MQPWKNFFDWNQGFAHHQIFDRFCAHEKLREFGDEGIGFQRGGGGGWGPPADPAARGVLVDPRGSPDRAAWLFLGECRVRLPPRLGRVEVNVSYSNVSSGSFNY